MSQHNVSFTYERVVLSYKVPAQLGHHAVRQMQNHLKRKKRRPKPEERRGQTEDFKAINAQEKR